MPRRGEVVAVAGCLTLLAIVVTLRVWLGWSTLQPQRWFDFDPLYRTADVPFPPTVGDFTSIVVDVPRDLTVARQLHEGRLAHWNPLSACGAPLWAEQGGPFFPLKLPFYLVPSLWSYDLFLVSRLVVAGLGAYGLARCRGLPPLASLVAGATFELSGSMYEVTPYGATSALCMLPWVVLGAAMVARRPGGPAAVAAGVSLGVAGTGGHPGLILLVYGAYAAALLGHLLTHRRSGAAAAATAAWGTLAALIGLALAAPSLLPLAELSVAGSSYKLTPAGDSAWDLALAISRHGLPFALFAPSVLAFASRGLATNHSADGALGICALVLAVGGLLQRGIDAALVAVALLGVVLTTAPPGLYWITHLPGLHLILPYYAGALLVLPLTQAIGSAVAALGSERGLRASLVAWVVVLAGFASLALVGKPELPGTFISKPFGPVLREVLETPGGLLRLVIPPAVTGAALAACWMLRRTSAARWYPSVFAALAIGEQIAVWAAFPSYERSAVLSSGPSAAVEFLQSGLADGGARFSATPYVVGNGLTPMLYGLRDARGVSALPVERYQAYVRAAGDDSGQLTLETLPSAHSALLDLAAVRYVAASHVAWFPQWVTPPPRDDPHMRLVYSDQRQLAIYENRAALPRARIVHRAIPVADEDEARDALGWIAGQHTHASELGLGTAVILEPDAHGTVAPRLGDEGVGDEWVRIVDESDPDRLVLDAQLDAPGLVTVADTYFPGWTATVDGAASPIYPANLAFRAVYVPQGRHAVVFRYRPRSFAYGCGLALVAAGACAALIGAARHGRSAPAPR